MASKQAQQDGMPKKERKSGRPTHKPSEGDGRLNATVKSPVKFHVADSELSGDMEEVVEVALRDDGHHISRRRQMPFAPGHSHPAGSEGCNKTAQLADASAALSPNASPNSGWSEVESRSRSGCCHICASMAANTKWYAKGIGDERQLWCMSCFTKKDQFDSSSLFAHPQGTGRRVQTNVASTAVEPLSTTPAPPHSTKGRRKSLPTDACASVDHKKPRISRNLEKAPSRALKDSFEDSTAASRSAKKSGGKASLKLDRAQPAAGAVVTDAHGRTYYTADNDTVQIIASKFNVPLEKIIDMNKQKFPIKPKSKFFELTPISLPLCEFEDRVSPQGCIDSICFSPSFRFSFMLGWCTGRNTMYEGLPREAQESRLEDVEEISDAMSHASSASSASSDEASSDDEDREVGIANLNLLAAKSPARFAGLNGLSPEMIEKVQKTDFDSWDHVRRALACSEDSEPFRQLYTMAEEYSRSRLAARAAEKDRGQLAQLNPAGYFASFAKTSARKSDKTLADVPLASDEAVAAAMQRLGCDESPEILQLHAENAGYFEKWKWHLDCGMNILTYGFGSKKELLDKFAMVLNQDGCDVVTLNGYHTAARPSPLLTLSLVFPLSDCQRLPLLGAFDWACCGALHLLFE
jgi:hypothetical protein